MREFPDGDGSVIKVPYLEPDDYKVEFIDVGQDKCVARPPGLHHRYTLQVLTGIEETDNLGIKYQKRQMAEIIVTRMCWKFTQLNDMGKLSDLDPWFPKQ